MIDTTTKEGKALMITLEALLSKEGIKVNEGVREVNNFQEFFKKRGVDFEKNEVFDFITKAKRNALEKSIMETEKALKGKGSI